MDQQIDSFAQLLAAIPPGAAGILGVTGAPYPAIPDGLGRGTMSGVGTRLVWFRHEFPWLRPGFLQAVATDYAETFERDLEARQFEVRRMAPVDETAMFRDLGRLLAFPDYYGGSGWDSVWDCFSDIALPDRLALFWEAVAGFAERDPKAFGEATHMLSAMFESVENAGKQLVLVLVGDGPSFARP